MPGTKQEIADFVTWKSRVIDWIVDALDWDQKDATEYVARIGDAVWRHLYSERHLGPYDAARMTQDELLALKKELGGAPYSIARGGNIAPILERIAGVGPPQDAKPKTLRDEFAIAALTGLIAGGWYKDLAIGVSEAFANTSYAIADAMLKARDE